MVRYPLTVVLVPLACCLSLLSIAFDAAGQDAPQSAWRKVESAFAPPEEYREDFGSYRSPLVFNDGREVKTAEDWQRRRAEILATWEGLIGTWPKVIEKQVLDYGEKVDR